MAKILYLRPRNVLWEMEEEVSLKPRALWFLRRLTAEYDYELVFLRGRNLPPWLERLLQSEAIRWRSLPAEDMPGTRSDEPHEAFYLLSADPADERLARLRQAHFCLMAPDTPFADWAAVFRALGPEQRTAVVERRTRETDIRIRISLDGIGHAAIHTGIGFFDHMLEQIARHGAIDLDIQVKGDLHIDEHHTIEDTALALGQALTRALGDKRGIQRYGFCLPMDEAQARIALDFGGRPWLVWQADFQREKIGEMPTEMFEHFFKSFSDAARCNLHIQATGRNEHHKIEAIFKAVARAIRMAKSHTGNQELPSTKGLLE